MQDVFVAANILGHTVPMSKYVVLLTVADERDGALSGSTLKEAKFIVLTNRWFMEKIG
ncbi:MAG: hypothetical protein WAK17_30055 [Candidatus Nitrosopolaris sp.]|jgi:deoxyhypusine synthase